MHTSKEELERRLSKLEGDVSWLVKRYPNRAEFDQEFAGQADFIVNSAPASDGAWVLGEIDRILIKFGMSPRKMVCST
jgi:hypothetical protein